MVLTRSAGHWPQELAGACWNTPDRASQERSMSTNATHPENDTGTNRPYTTHTEPHSQGGEAYHRCKNCGAELLTKLGGFDNLVHKPTCKYIGGRK